MMNRPLALLMIGLVFGGGVGFVLAAANGVTLDGHDHAMHAVTGDGKHDHGELVEAEGAVPTLMAKITPDPVSGWNLHLTTTQFTFAPAQAGATHVSGEGHAHVYANGQKIARVYGHWFHIDHLPEGDVELSVTLNANDHRTISVDGTAVEVALSLSTKP